MCAYASEGSSSEGSGGYPVRGPLVDEGFSVVGSPHPHSLEDTSLEDPSLVLSEVFSSECPLVRCSLVSVL